MSARPIIDAGPGLNLLPVNKERLLIAVLGPISAPETVQDEVFRKSAQDRRFRAAAVVWRKLTLINREVVARFRRGECGPDKVTGADIDAITCPVLILAGEDDPMTPAESARRLVSSVHRAAVDLRVFPGVGHGVFRQTPAQAFALLRTFLAERDVCPNALPGSGR